MTFSQICRLQDEAEEYIKLGIKAKELGDEELKQRWFERANEVISKIPEEK